MSPGGLTSRAFAFGALSAWPPVDDDAAPHPAAAMATIAAPATSAARLDMRPPEAVAYGTVRRPYVGPVSAPPVPGQREVKPARAARVPPYAGREVSRRILIVEDDEAIASGLWRVLDSQGYDVRHVARGGLALRDAAEPTALV